MANFFPTTLNLPLIGSKSISNVLTKRTLESTYQTESATVATKTFDTAGYTNLNLDISYTMGAAETSNTIQLKVEGSPDGTNFYSLSNDETSLTVSTTFPREFTMTGVDGDTLNISIFMNIGYRYMRISIKETGVAANKGTVYVEATMAGK